MTHQLQFLPEEYTSCPTYTYAQIQNALSTGEILRGRVVRSDPQGNLHLRVSVYRGVIPAAEAVAPFISGAQRDIAVLSCVGHVVAFTVIEERTAPNGDTVFVLSRRAAQERAMAHLEEHCLPGTILPAQVTHLAPFGAFVDVGCGVISLIPISQISMARITHPAQRFSPRQRIRVWVRRIDRQERRLYLGHRELLGTWLENAGAFTPGETVRGIVRGQQEYGTFVELTPNLVGLSDQQPSLPEGTAVSVFIKAIQPQRKKIKLRIIEDLGLAVFPTPLTYRLTDGEIENWIY